MRQVNTSGYPLTLPTLGVTLERGDEIDHPERLAGCTPVDELPAEGDEDGTPSKTTRARSTAGEEK